MYKKIFRSTCFASILVMLVSVMLVSEVLYRYLDNQIVEELKAEAAYAALGLEENGVSYLEDAADMEDRRLTLMDQDGSVLYDSDSSAAQMENHADREEIVQAAETGEGVSRRYSNTILEKSIYYALRLENGQILRVSTEQFSRLRLLGSISLPVIGVILIAVILSAALSAGLSRSIIRPLNQIDLDAPQKGGVYPELEPLMSRLDRQRHIINTQLVTARQKQEEFRLITENMSEGFLVVDERANLLTYNSAALRLLERGEPSMGSAVSQLSGDPEFRGLVHRALSGSHATCVISAENRRCQLMANPVTEGKNIIGAVVVILDVTEQTEREQLRREFTANVSHELKTPLTSISGFAELMRTGMVAQSDVIDFSNTIYDEAQRLNTLVSDIIRLSELDEGPANWEMHQVDLLELSEKILHRLEPAAAKADIAIAVSGDHAKVSGVEKILDEMIYNLCDNAIKYNRPGGRVDVFVNKGNPVVLRVRDTGIGIPPAHQTRVFERFYRVDKSHSRDMGGTGLGLSIVKHAAMFHGAEISLKSVVDRGTTITITFRKEEKQEEASAAPTQPEGSAQEASADRTV